MATALAILRYLPALIALMSAGVSFIKAMEVRKATKNKVILDGLRTATKTMNDMATVAASPLSDEEVEDRLAKGTF